MAVFFFLFISSILFSFPPSLCVYAISCSSWTGFFFLRCCYPYLLLFTVGFWVFNFNFIASFLASFYNTLWRDFVLQKNGSKCSKKVFKRYPTVQRNSASSNDYLYGAFSKYSACTPKYILNYIHTGRQTTINIFPISPPFWTRKFYVYRKKERECKTLSVPSASKEGAKRNSW